MNFLIFLKVISKVNYIAVTKYSKVSFVLCLSIIRKIKVVVKWYLLQNSRNLQV